VTRPGGFSGRPVLDWLHEARMRAATNFGPHTAEGGAPSPSPLGARQQFALAQRAPLRAVPPGLCSRRTECGGRRLD
jgi:hypothetical protein